MKAIVTTRYGPPEVLELQETLVPVPRDDEVLIRLYASSVNPLDGFTIRGPLLFLPAIARRLKPAHRITGADLAGIVEQVGRNATKFHPGDEVFGGSFGKHGLGGFAEYVCASETCLAKKPINLTFQEAAAVPVAAITALQALRDHGQIRQGQRVLIDGASGGVGTFAVQIAKAFGTEVTAICSPNNMETARSIGADHAIDYTREDFARNGERYDLILGANAHHSVLAYWRALRRDGTFVMVGGNPFRILETALLGPLLSMLGSRKMRFFIAKIKTADLDFLKEIIEAGKVSPVIDRSYPLCQVADALRYREQGHARGKIVIKIA
jgi:NADPH:quinone reductase-like Zn-dependent oxidoreductase